MGRIVERHDANWHRDWDRHRGHFFHNRFFVFVDGFWRNLASAFALGFGKENASALIKALEAKGDVAVKAA